MKLSQEKINELIREMYEPMSMARRFYIQLLAELKTRDRYSFAVGDSIDLDKASYSTLIRIASKNFRNDINISRSLLQINSITRVIGEILSKYDGYGRFVQLSDMDKWFVDYDADYGKTINKTDSQFFINYSTASLDWLIRAYNSIVTPNKYNHRPYDRTVSIIMKIDYVESLFRTGNLKMTKVDTWEDPYENFFLRHILPVYKGLVYENESDNVYGMCWSTKQSSDALWRIYSDSEKLNGVQLNTTISKLINYVIDNDFPISAFGGITYDNEQGQLLNEFRINCDSLMYEPFPPIEKLSIESLYMKRNAFDHEREYRTVVWLDWEMKQDMVHDGEIEADATKHINDRFLNISVNPFDLFDKIVLDPRLVYKPRLRQHYTERLKNVGVDHSKIAVSNLYKYI